MFGSLGNFLEPIGGPLSYHALDPIIIYLQIGLSIGMKWPSSLGHVTSSMFCNWNKILYSSDQISGNFLIIVLSFLISYIYIQVFYILGTYYPSKCSEW